MNSHSIKVLISIIILFAIIISVSVFTTYTLDISSKKLTAHIEQVENSTRTGDWVKAEEGLSYIDNIWLNTEKSWAMLIDHIEIDNIDMALARMSRYVEAQDTSSALAEAATLKMYIKHIPEKEYFSMKNLF